MKRLFFILLTVSLIISCKSTNKELQIKAWKEEIVSTEKVFAEMAASDGVAAAFIAFADDSAVMNRNEKIIKGLPEIKAYFETHDYSNVKLQWAPDFVEVSSAGDLAYTYGKYTFSLSDSTGQTQESQGIFHTVWKRQADGSWKFVWD